jgi:hypothetical protein
MNASSKYRYRYIIIATANSAPHMRPGMIDIEATLFVVCKKPAATFIGELTIRRALPRIGG